MEAKPTCPHRWIGESSFGSGSGTDEPTWRCQLCGEKRSPMPPTSEPMDETSGSSIGVLIAIALFLLILFLSGADFQY